MMRESKAGAPWQSRVVGWESWTLKKTEIMLSGPITSREIDGKIVETVADFIFLGSKITADGD